MKNEDIKDAILAAVLLFPIIIFFGFILGIMSSIHEVRMLDTCIMAAERGVAQQLKPCAKMIVDTK